MRKCFSCKVVPVLVFLFLVAVRLSAQSDTLSFLHISDLHLIFDLEIFQKDLAQSRSHYGNGVKPFKDFLKKKPKETGAEFVIATGDLVDFYEAQKETGEMFGTQIEQFSKLLKPKKNMVFCTLGNHDISAYSWGDSSRVSTQNTTGEARAAWELNLPCFRNGTYYSRNVEVGKTNYRLIFLDNGYNTVSENESITIPYISREQLHWLEDQFNESDEDVEILLMHIPINPEKIGLPEADGLYSVLSHQPSLKLVLAGHNHRNIMKEFTTTDSHFYQVQTAAFAQNSENWRVIRFTEDQILISFPGKTGNEFVISTKLN